jgi:hypothetical protein
MEPIIPSRALPNSNSNPTPLELSPTNTIVDSDATPNDKPKSISAGPIKSTLPDQNNKDKDTDTDTNGDVIVISQKKKWSLLMVFCLGFFIDIWMYSGESPFIPPSSISYTSLFYNIRLPRPIPRYLWLPSPISPSSLSHEIHLEYPHLRRQC